jgi:hypothetical protein
MSGDEEPSGRQVRAWTVGELRKALEGLPGDLPVRVVIAEAPDGRFVGEQLVISAGPWNDLRGGAPPDYFEIGCQVPSTWYRRSADPN